MKQNSILFFQNLIQSGSEIDLTISLNDLGNYITFLLKQALIKVSPEYSVSIKSTKGTHSCCSMDCENGNQEFTICILSNKFSDIVAIVFIDDNHYHQCRDVFEIAAQIHSYR